MIGGKNPFIYSYPFFLILVSGTTKKIFRGLPGRPLAQGLAGCRRVRIRVLCCPPLDASINGRRGMESYLLYRSTSSGKTNNDTTLMASPRSKGQKPR
ncbi:MAG: hypothetical protein WCJ47_05455 [Methanomicrobiales archaeon]